MRMVSIIFVHFSRSTSTGICNIVCRNPVKMQHLTRQLQV